MFGAFFVLNIIYPVAIPTIYDPILCQGLSYKKSKDLNGSPTLTLYWYVIETSPVTIHEENNIVDRIEKDMRKYLKLEVGFYVFISFYIFQN